MRTRACFCPKGVGALGGYDGSDGLRSGPELTSGIPRVQVLLPVPGRSRASALLRSVFATRQLMRRRHGETSATTQRIKYSGIKQWMPPPTYPRNKTSSPNHPARKSSMVRKVADWCWREV
ncbi:hypothetical protein EZZ81_11520 [Pseudomonas viridiflava]|uniref:Uncharacterized protein n=1 Tax=Pseudomonas viridiflava TaxID=33069 RepID=A0AA46VXD3_PSEVI|nr:hypothetical protein EZZ81_11520 [Pseudomonas viridiflava]